MDDQVLVYRGADQPDMSVINPESDVWQHIQVICKSLARLTRSLTILTDSARLSGRELANPILRY